jgi:hypothetical protein
VVARAVDVVRRLTLLELDRDLVLSAAGIEPAALRSLDAIHLASALSLGSELGAFVTYDHRLAEAARAANLPILTPS